jgi:hypothetical protein
MGGGVVKRAAPVCVGTAPQLHWHTRLVVPAPNIRDPKAHYMPADAAHIATWAGILLKHDKGGLRYPAA